MMKFYRKPSGVYIALEDSVPVSTNLVEVTKATYDNVVTRAQKIKETKVEAQRRIFARFPQHRQANMMARQSELDAIETGRLRDSTGALQPQRALTTSEIAELASFSAAWTWIKSVRAASGLIEKDIQTSPDPANFNVASSPRWPA